MNERGVFDFGGPVWCKDCLLTGGYIESAEYCEWCEFWPCSECIRYHSKKECYD